MIFLEQAINQILLEEGQTIVTLEDLEISWKQLENIFIGTFEQAKDYITIYDWTTQNMGPTPQKMSDWTNVRHISIAATPMQRMMPDYPHSFWDFNPYTKDGRSLAHINYAVDYGKHATLDYLEYSLPMSFTANAKKAFLLPCTFDENSFSLDDISANADAKDENNIILDGTRAVGNFDNKTLRGHLIFDTDYKGTLKVTSKYVGIKELDLTCELFYTWLKGNVLQFIGAQKQQIDLQGVGLPFDINGDHLLERGRQFIDRVEELKGTKSHWSNF